MVPRLTSAFLALASTVVAVDALSVSSNTRDYASSARATAIAKTKDQIANTARFLTIDGVQYPMYNGPIGVPGSLADHIQIEEALKFVALSSPTPEILGSLATNMSTNLTSLAGYNDFYTKATQWIERPMSFDNSDETFGAQRLSIKSFALRLVTPLDLDRAKLSLSDQDLQRICGRGAHELFNQKQLFVEDFHDAAQYNDPKRPDKYVPNVVGFFCQNKATKHLLPIEIRMLDTKLTYTPQDSILDWTIAKLALEAASSNVHQWKHMAETHAVTSPLRVEAMRTMSVDHPVLALLQRHTAMDFGLERLGAAKLLNASTNYDLMSGWGASGSARFLWDQTQKGLSFQHQTFYNDLVRRGLQHIENHKYVAYANLYNNALTTFVEEYLAVYYQDDDDVVSDVEVQNWANTSAHIPHIRDFPTAFETVRQLRDVLSHLIFTSTVRHHGMNGQSTWHMMSPPFAPGALWKPLPTTKLHKSTIDESLLYTTPINVLPNALIVSASFYRDIPVSENFFSAYKVQPFSIEDKLQPAIQRLNATLQDIETTITTLEATAKWPYLVLRPSQLPFDEWI